ncbi:MAG: AAA family ATPase, partial [Gammaproteobacteria bacterium]|nr:AAA family ATPase [Gammaproteobacteria bacterium]
MKLTKPQQQAIRYSGRNLQLIACAGSGKTEVVARRVAHLLTRRRARLKPENIIAFTFTNKAAAELKERILARTKDALGEMPIDAAEMYVGTIHGFCQELLKSEVPKYLKHEPLDAIRQKLYVDRNSKKTGLTECKAANGRPLRRYVDTERYTAALSALREDDIQRRYLRDCSVAKVGLPLYCAQTDDDGYLDFSGLLDLAAQELDKNADLRKRLAKRIKYVIVDEYQDVNPVQERLIKHLHDLGAGLCVVGDDDQTIYQWRGSAVDNILTFEDRYPDVQQIRLQDNFRSSVGVIETASRFVGSIDDRLPKSMTFGGSQELEKGDIVALSFDTPAQE